jgi:hypothetical protein
LNLGIAEIVLLLRAFKIADVRVKLQQVWKGLRISFAVFTVLAVLNIVDAYVYWGSWLSEQCLVEVKNWSAIAFTNALCGALTTPACRNRFCIWLAALGRSGEEKHAAEEAARLIWVDFDALEQKPDAAEVIVGKPRDAGS